MRKSTIVVAVLAATVASAHAAPKSEKLTRGSEIQINSQASQASTVRPTAKSVQGANATKAVSVPHPAARAGAGASVHWSRSLGSPAAPATAPASVAEAQAVKARVATRTTKPRVVRAEARQLAVAKRLSLRTKTVALTREVPTDQIERPAHSVTAAAPTGSIQGMVTAAAQRAGVNPALGHAVVKVESMYQPKATGKGGYIGLMQLSYQTAKGMGFRGSRQALYEPSANLQYGMRYLAEAVRKAGGSTCGAVSKYQGGHGVRGVTRAGAVYCAKVRRYMASAG